MEQKKFDPWQFVGFFLIALILTWMLYNQPPVEEATNNAQHNRSRRLGMHRTQWL